MSDSKELEADFIMYREAAKDLEENGGDKDIVQDLTRKMQRTGQVLNLIGRSTKSKERYFFC